MNCYWEIFSYFNLCINAKWIILYFVLHRHKQRHHFTNKDLYSQSYGFSNSHVRIWDLDHEEGWVPKNWCFQIVVLEKTLKSPLDYRKLTLVNPKGNQPWIFIGMLEYSTWHVRVCIFLLSPSIAQESGLRAEPLDRVVIISKLCFYFSL